MSRISLADESNDFDMDLDVDTMEFDDLDEVGFYDPDLEPKGFEF